MILVPVLAAVEPRADSTKTIRLVSPETEVNSGLWSLFFGATVFLGLRIWCKVSRRHGLWYDDYILLLCWIILLLNDALISHEFATGYVTPKWDDRMHILINMSTCGTLVNQSLTKTAFGVTLLRMSNRWQQAILWFCIATMNGYMVAKLVVQWAKVCDKGGYDSHYRLDFCVVGKFRDEFKEGGNVYNIIMDFVFALFPWLITWGLDMKRAEKMALCVTMSLGIIVAVIAAVRTAWKDDDDDNSHDPLYHWRNGLSMVWFSSEIAGTIMVQCIPVLRPFLREVHASLASRKLASTDDNVPQSPRANTKNDAVPVASLLPLHGAAPGRKGDFVGLRTVVEEPDKEKTSSWSPLPALPHVPVPAPVPLAGREAGSGSTPQPPLSSASASHAAWLRLDPAWPFAAEPNLSSLDDDARTVSRDESAESWVETERSRDGSVQPTGLSPPPRRG